MTLNQQLRWFDMMDNNVLSSGSVHSLSLTTTMPLWSSQQACEKIINSCPNLLNLKLLNVDLENIETWPTKAINLRLERCAFDLNKIRFLIHLEILHLVDCFVDKNLLIDIITGLPKLVNLTLNHLMNIGTPFFLVNLPYLTHLSLSNTNLVVSQLEPIKNLKLTHLEIVNLPISMDDSDYLSDILETLFYLQYLDIRNTKGGIVALLDLEMPLLTTLKLGVDYESIRRSIAKALLKNLPVLEHVEFNNNTPVSDSLLESFAAKSLQTLLLSSQPESPQLRTVSPQSLLKISTSMGPHLKVFRCHNYLLTSDVLTAFSNHCKNLQMLDLKNCSCPSDPLLTIESVKAILQLPQLVFIDIRGQISKAMGKSIKSLKNTYYKVVIIY